MAARATAGALQAPTDERPEARSSLGLLMPLAVLMAAGILVVALADAASREGHAGKQGLFWTGILLIVVPTAARLCSSGAKRRERVWLVLLFGLSLYLVKFTYSPSRLAFSDEFVHFRSVEDDLRSGHLFSFNPLLPEAARYPGLGDVTSGLVRLTGLSIASSGLVVIGSARLVLMLAMFFVVERLSRSSRVAGLACFIYAANPNFLYWSAQFSYESLALPLAAFVLYLTARRSATRGWRLSALAGLSVLAVVVSHHLSSYFLVAVLAAWSAVVLWRRRERDRGREYAPVGLALVAMGAVGAWLAFVAPITGQYLGSIASSTGRGLFDVVTGASSTRALFTSGAQVAPAWERVLSVGSVGLTLLVLAIAAVAIWRRRRDNPLMLAPLLLAVGYPLLLPLRFIGSAAETANRSTEFLFLGLGAVLALVGIGLRPGRGERAALYRGGAAIACALVVLGGVAVSWQYSERLPQDASAARPPYELTAQAIDADRWAATRLGSGHRFVSDFLDRLGLATYGQQRTLFAPVDGPSAWEVLEPPRINAHVRDAIRRGRIEFVMVDRRLSSGIPTSGWYFDRGEPEAGRFKAPIAAGTLGKFDGSPRVSRLYDNGEQQIYDVAALR
jgi:hypothetical protein